MPEQINSVAGQLVGVPVGQVYTAGKGIVIDNVNKTVRTDETVLFTNNGGTSQATLSESPFNFERIKLLIGENNSAYSLEEKTVWMMPNSTYFNLQFVTGQVNCYVANIRYTISGNTITADKVFDTKINYDTGTSFSFEHNTSLLNNIWKVIGVNRISGGN